MGATENVQRGDGLVASVNSSPDFLDKNMLPDQDVPEPAPDDKPPETFQLKAKLDCDGGLGFGPLWKLERRESGSLYWRRDSNANATSKVRFRYDVDVLEFLPHPHEHDRLSHERSDSSDAEDDTFDDDWFEDDPGWFRKRASLISTKSASRALASTKDSSFMMSLVCVAAILFTAYVQLVVA